MYIQKLNKIQHASRSTLTVENPEQLKHTQKLTDSNQNQKNRYRKTTTNLTNTARLINLHCQQRC